jgi:hypothetical protein
MDSSIVTAMAAASGSMVGAAASIVTTWMTQRTQRVRARIEDKLRSREALYGEFVTEASRVTVEAMSRTLEQPDAVVKLYGILGRVRLVASQAVLAAGEKCTRQIVDFYLGPNLTAAQIRAALEREFDPIKEFSAAARDELLEIAAGG